MVNLITLGDLHKHFEEARDKLSLNRQRILSTSPLEGDFSRNEYSFAYMQAERVGMDVITQSLQDVAWLPMQLDPKSEIVLQNRESLKRWLASSIESQPDGTVFGNDFIHALTRTGMKHGWQSRELNALAKSIGELFHDLSCLIGLIYYGVWMSENNIEGLPVSDPLDLERTAQEIAQLTRSPEIARLLKTHKQKSVEKKTMPPHHKRGRPILRVIENGNWEGDTSRA